MIKYDIITIGDVSEDIFLIPEKIKVEHNSAFISKRAIVFELGDKIHVKNIHYDIGGSAANTAVGFARMSYKTASIYAIGKDTPGGKIFQKLQDEGVHCDYRLESSDLSTHFSVIFNIGEERTVFVYRGLEDYAILTPRKSLAPRWYYVGPMGENTRPVFDRLINISSEKGSMIAWNPGSCQIDRGVNQYKSMLMNVRILILNREEATKFIKTPVLHRVEEIMKMLKSCGPEIVVITAGQDGAWAYNGKTKFRIEALNKKRVDATGAGDSFAVGFLGRLMQKEGKESIGDDEDIKEAMRWGIINSTSVVNQLGAQTGLLSKDQIEEELEKHPRLFVETN